MISHISEPLKIAFFDVDETVINCDSFMVLIKMEFKKAPWRLFILLLLSPFVLLRSLIARNRGAIKSAVLWSLTVGLSKKEMVKLLTANVYQNTLAKLWFTQATNTINDLRAQGIHIVYVSASGQLWLRKLINNCDKGKKNIIGTRLKFFWGGVILQSKNCYHVEKIHRILQCLGNNFTWYAAYSDSSADIPLLTPALNKYVINPKPKHLRKFIKAFKPQAFAILSWSTSKES